VYNAHANNEEDFDAVILASLFRSQHWSPLQQLSLSMLWDRVDIAKNEVFVYGREFSRGKRILTAYLTDLRSSFDHLCYLISFQEHLEHAMMQALIFDRLDFVSLLLEHGLNMQTFLTPSRLETLYSIDRKESSILRMLVSDHATGSAKKKKASIPNEKQSNEILSLHAIG
jgi:hypothetical protein